MDILLFKICWNEKYIFELLRKGILIVLIESETKHYLYYISKCYYLLFENEAYKKMYIYK